MATESPDFGAGFAALLNSTDLMGDLFNGLFNNLSDFSDVNTSLIDTASYPSVLANHSYSNDTNTTLNATLLLEDVVPFELPHPVWLTIFLAVAASVVCIVTILGNILVLLSFVLERSIRQPTNYFIASLAMSDLLIGTFSMPCFTLYLLLGRWPLGEIICDLWLSLDWTVCLASQYTVFFITADRFCSVKIPAKYRNWRTENKVKVMIALSWIIPSVVFFTSIVGWQYFVNGRTVAEGSCEVQFMSNPLFTFFLTIGYYWTTLFVMIVLYVMIYRVALALQKKANEKHKKMTHAMEMAAEQKKKQGAGGAKGKDKKRVENNNARYPRCPNDNTLTTSFSKHSDAEYSKPSEEDRSSSPAFASDEDSSGEQHHRKEGCYVNSAVQTEPTLRGMLGTSFNHMSRLAFSISGTSVSASQASASSDKDVSDEHHALECEANKPLLIQGEVGFKPVPEGPPPYDDIVKEEQGEKLNQPSSPLLENDVLDGLKYIDEDSLKSLTSSENMKLLAEIKDKHFSSPRVPELESPVWRKRGMEEDRSYLVPTSTDSYTSSEAPSGEHRKQPVKHNNISSIESPAAPHRSSHHHHHRHRGENSVAAVKHEHLAAQSSNNSSDSKGKSRYGSPLQSLVKSLRSTSHGKPKQKKPAKSKSENRARKALRTISIILGAYVLCWTPYHIMVFIIGVCGNWNCINLQLYYFTYWLCYLNSPINPFCYALANAQFKRTFLRILKLDFHRT